jgi:CheY-like chemotaxis protein
MAVMRTLIIEDDQPTAEMLAIMLEGMGIEVCGSEATEAGAISAAANCHPDLMIVDINLRVGTGTAAVDEILTHGHVPHIFVSADISQVKLSHPRAIMLSKPYVYVQMVDAIQRATAIVN